MIFSLTISEISQAKPTCDETLKACDEALKLSAKQIETYKKLTKEQEELVKLLSEQRNAAYEKAQENAKTTDWYVWGIVGVAAGVILTRGLR